MVCLHTTSTVLHDVLVGAVPANGKVDILITFTPTEYSTAVAELKVNGMNRVNLRVLYYYFFSFSQLELSQFNSNPLLCTITGSSSPGLAA